MLNCCIERRYQRRGESKGRKFGGKKGEGIIWPDCRWDMSFVICEMDRYA